MTTITLYLIGAGASVLLSGILVRLLRSSLAELLEELWASRARAGYWAGAFCVTMLLLGIYSGTGTSGYGHGGSLPTHEGFFALAGQLRGTLLGLFLSLGFVSLIVLRFMSVADRPERPDAPFRTRSSEERRAPQS